MSRCTTSTSTNSALTNNVAEECSRSTATPEPIRAIADCRTDTVKDIVEDTNGKLIEPIDANGKLTTVLGRYIGLPDIDRREYNIPPGINPLMPSGYDSASVDQAPIAPVAPTPFNSKSTGNTGMIIGLILGVIALIALFYWFKDSFKR